MGLLRIARKLVQIAVAVIVIVIVAGILLYVFNQNKMGTFTNSVIEVADTLVTPFRELFEFRNNDVQIAVNFGIGAVAWLILAAIVDGVLAFVMKRRTKRETERGKADRAEAKRGKERTDKKETAAAAAAGAGAAAGSGKDEHEGSPRAEPVAENAGEGQQAEGPEAPHAEGHPTGDAVEQPVAEHGEEPPAEGATVVHDEPHGPGGHPIAEHGDQHDQEAGLTPEQRAERVRQGAERARAASEGGGAASTRPASDGPDEAETVVQPSAQQDGPPHGRDGPS